MCHHDTFRPMKLFVFTLIYLNSVIIKIMITTHRYILYTHVDTVMQISLDKF